MPQCIYCLENKDKALFNRQHVIPQSFGHFRDALVLHNTVCQACNQFIGDELELFLGRDSYEVLMLYNNGFKSPEKASFLKDGRIRIRLAEPGVWQGLIMRLLYSEEAKKVVVEPVTQVGFRKVTDEWMFFEAGKIPDKTVLEKDGFIIKGTRTMKFNFENDEERQRLIAELKEKGINLLEEGEEDIPYDLIGREVEVEGVMTIDEILWRSIAKIGFEYMAKIHGANFTLDSSFNGIRDYVRYGKRLTYHPVQVGHKPILQEENNFNIKFFEGHLITLQWEKGWIVANVTLGNDIFYKVLLGKRYNGIIFQVASGHAFDSKSRSVNRMGNLSGLILPNPLAKVHR